MGYIIQGCPKAIPRRARPWGARASCRRRRGTTSATLLVVEFWADPAAAAAVLPAPLEPHPDGGRAAAMFIDWQSCSDDGDELLDPSRSQYKEFFITVNALYEGEEVAYCPYIWVDRDFALARGWIQGFPKKLGSIWMTRTFGLDTPRRPRRAPGAAYGATCAAYERRLAEATVTLERPSETGSDPQRPADRQRPPLPAPREGPPRRARRPRARPLARLRPQRLRDLGGRARRWSSSTRPGEELAALAPVRVGKGWRLHDRLLGRRPRDADRAVSRAPQPVAEVAGVEVSTDHFIGGERVASAERFDDLSPIDGRVLAEVSAGGAAEAAAALAAAARRVRRLGGARPARAGCRTCSGSPS